MKPVKAGEKQVRVNCLKIGNLLPPSSRLLIANCCQVVVAPVMASVADVLESVRQLLSWLERKPFDRSDEYHGVRTTLIRSLHAHQLHRKIDNLLISA